MPKIEILNPLDYPNWDDLVLSTKDYSFFHSSAWARVLSESYGYKLIYFTILDNNRILGLIPLMEIKSFLTGSRGVSLPFSDYCEPIISEKSSFQEVMDYIFQYGRKSGWKYVELRGGKKFFNGIPSSTFYYGNTLDLSRKEEEIFSGLRDSTRRNIKKAVREGVEVKISFSIESLKAFHRLNCMTKRRHGLPPQPFYFFKRLYDHVISQNHGIIVLASYQKKIIAGAVYFHFGEKAIFKYGASNKNFHPLRPNNLVMWKAIEYYARNGYRSLGFGRTEPENIGLQQFKKGWGVKDERIIYFKYDFGKEAFVNGNLETNLPFKLLTKIPSPLLKFTGFLFYRHSG